MFGFRNFFSDIVFVRKRKRVEKIDKKHKDWLTKHIDWLTLFNPFKKNIGCCVCVRVCVLYVSQSVCLWVFHNVPNTRLWKPFDVSRKPTYTHLHTPLHAYTNTQIHPHAHQFTHTHAQTSLSAEAHSLFPFHSPPFPFWNLIRQGFNQAKSHCGKFARPMGAYTETGGGVWGGGEGLCWGRRGIVSRVINMHS